jgi:hypothetical protein
MLFLTNRRIHAYVKTLSSKGSCYVIECDTPPEGCIQLSKFIQTPKFEYYTTLEQPSIIEVFKTIFKPFIFNNNAFIDHISIIEGIAIIKGKDLYVRGLNVDDGNNTIITYNGYMCKVHHSLLDGLFETAYGIKYSDIK